MVERMDELVREFATRIIARDEASDPTVANAHSEKCLDAFDELTSFGDQGREALCRLFEHEDPSVRCAAAAFLLRYKTDAAMRVLEVLARGRGVVALAAEQCIKNWKNGSWELDPEPCDNSSSD